MRLQAASSNPLIEIIIFPYVNPHTGYGPKDSSVVQSSLYLHPSIRLSFYLFSIPHRFLTIIGAVHNCTQRMWLQAMESNPASGSILCISVCLSGFLQAFCDFCISIISSVGFHLCGAFIPILGSKGPLWGSVELIWPSVCPSVSPSICTVVYVSIWQAFWWSVIVRSAYRHRPRGQIPWVAV